MQPYGDKEAALEKSRKFVEAYKQRQAERAAAQNLTAPIPGTVPYVNLSNLFTGQQSSSWDYPGQPTDALVRTEQARPQVAQGGGWNPQDRVVTLQELDERLTKFARKEEVNKSFETVGEVLQSQGKVFVTGNTTGLIVVNDTRAFNLGVVSGSQALPAPPQAPPTKPPSPPPAPSTPLEKPKTKEGFKVFVDKLAEFETMGFSKSDAAEMALELAKEKDEEVLAAAAAAAGGAGGAPPPPPAPPAPPAAPNMLIGTVCVAGRKAVYQVMQDNQLPVTDATVIAKAASMSAVKKGGDITTVAARNYQDNLLNFGYVTHYNPFIKATKANLAAFDAWKQDHAFPTGIWDGTIDWSLHANADGSPP